MATFSRRGFVVGCSSAIAAMAGARLSYVAFGSPEQEPNQEVLLVVFLRGGIDGLNVVPVLGGVDRGIYEQQRENIQIPVTGDNAALQLDDRFGLHPAAAPLFELYQDKKFAVIHAAGLPSDTRSHFDAMKEMELGTPGYKNSHTGWLARHIQSANLTGGAVASAVSVGNLQPTSLAGSLDAIGMTSPNDFGFGGNWRYEDAQRSALRKMYGRDSWIHAAGTQTLDAIDLLELGNPGRYEPANGADYPNGGFGNNLKSIAQMIKLQLGMQIATVDLGGWDTHEYQGDAGAGYFSDRLGMVAQGLHAFYTDLSSDPNGANNGHRVTTVVMSEFGRSLRQNGSRGTDHGHGNVMFVLGENVNGGVVYGKWPGLGTNPDGSSQLYDGRDLAITTDYRQVLSEILIRRFANPNLGVVFPGYAEYQSLGIVTGTELPPVYDENASTPTPTLTPTKAADGGSAIIPPTVTSVPDQPLSTPTPVPTSEPTSMPTSTPTSTPNRPDTGLPNESGVYIPLMTQ
ncbi:MAG: DUF1501 domain-containing protein [Chloroflexota bacterium]